MQIGTYIKLILQKKNMTQQDLVNRINELHLANGTMYKNKISEMLNGQMSITTVMARKIEIALDLPKYSLVELVGFPTNDRYMRRLEELK